MLHKVELLIAGRGPEALSNDNLALFLGVTFFVHKEQALLFPERRVGKDHRIFLAPRRGKAVVPAMNHYPVAADAVEVQVHRAHAADLGR